jgi:hypothetical protein
VEGGSVSRRWKRRRERERTTHKKVHEGHIHTMPTHPQKDATDVAKSLIELEFIPTNIFFVYVRVILSNGDSKRKRKGFEKGWTWVSWHSVVFDLCFSSLQSCLPSSHYSLHKSELPPVPERSAICVLLSRHLQFCAGIQIRLNRTSILPSLNSGHALTMQTNSL